MYTNEPFEQFAAAQICGGPENDRVDLIKNGTEII